MKSGSHTHKEEKEDSRDISDRSHSNMLLESKHVEASASKRDPLALYYTNHTKKSLRIDPHFAQAVIPELIRKEDRDQMSVKNERKAVLARAFFLRNKIQPKKLEEYLKFVRVLQTETKTEFSGYLSGPQYFNEEKALEFLHEMDYSQIRAKFYLIFNHLYNYNRFNTAHPVDMSEKDMEDKIQAYMESLNETKQTQQDKWKEELEELFRERVPFLKLSHHLEKGKALKCEIPDYVKENLEKVTKLSKEIKKIMQDKAPFEKLLTYQKQCREMKVFSHDTQFFDEMVDKCAVWREKTMKTLEEQTTFKALQSLFNEFKNLPLSDDLFPKVKQRYETANGILEKLPNFSKVSKTRHNNDRVPLAKALEKLDMVDKCNIECDEFASFKEAIQKTQEFVECYNMFEEDDRAEKTQKVFKQLLIDATSLPFLVAVQDRLQDYCDYFTTIEKIRKNFGNKAKFAEVQSEIVNCKSRGFKTAELLEFETKLNNIVDIQESIKKFNVGESKFTCPELLEKNFGDLTATFRKFEDLVALVDEARALPIDVDDVETLSERLDSYKKCLVSLKGAHDYKSFKELEAAFTKLYNFKINCPLLNELHGVYVETLEWLLIASKAIQQVKPDFRSEALGNMDVNNLANIALKHQSIQFDNQFALLNALIERENSKLIENSQEYQTLINIRTHGELWNARTQELLQEDAQVSVDVIDAHIGDSKQRLIDVELLTQLEGKKEAIQLRQKASKMLANDELNQVYKQLFEHDSMKRLLDEIMAILSKPDEFEADTTANFFGQHVHFMYDMLAELESLGNRQPFVADDSLGDTLRDLSQKSIDLKMPKSQGNQLLREKLKHLELWESLFKKVMAIEKHRKSTRSTKRKNDRRGDRGKESANNKENGDEMRSANKGGDVKEEDEEKEDGVKMEDEVEHAVVNGAEKENPSEKLLDAVVKFVTKSSEAGQLLINRGYYFKLPLLFALMHTAFEWSLNSPHVLQLLNHLVSIFKYTTDVTESLSDKISIERLEELITSGRSFKCYIIECTRLKKLNQWMQAWLSIAKNILSARIQPKSKQNKLRAARKKALMAITVPSAKQLPQQAAMAASYEWVKRLKLEEFDVAFEEHAMIFDLIRREFGLIEPGDLKVIEAVMKSEERDEPPVVVSGRKERRDEGSAERNRRVSKRKRKLNTKLIDNDQGYPLPQRKNKGAAYAKFMGVNEKVAGVRGRKQAGRAGGGSTSRDAKRGSKKEVKRKYAKKAAVAQVPNELIVVPFGAEHEDPNKEYCICRRVWDQSSNMTECERCGEWFHNECIMAQPNRVTKVRFICPGCVKRYCLEEDPNEETYDPSVIDFAKLERYEKISIAEFRDFVQEGKMIGVAIPELEDILDLEDQVERWEKVALEQIARGAGLDLIESLHRYRVHGVNKTKDPVLNELEISEIDRNKALSYQYLESLSIPIQLPYVSEILELLQTRDVGFWLYEHQYSRRNLKSLKKILSNAVVMKIKESNVDIARQYEELEKKKKTASEINTFMNEFVKGGTWEVAEFQKILALADRLAIQHEKLDQAKKQYDKFCQLETEVKRAIEARADIGGLSVLKARYAEEAFPFQASQYERLDKVTNEAQMWNEKVLSAQRKELFSEAILRAFIEEGEKLSCQVPLLDSLKKNLRNMCADTANRFPTEPMTSASLNGNPTMFPNLFRR